MNLLADTCFWISLCDSSELDSVEAKAIMEKILDSGNHKIMVPHPVLYETLCSKMVKKPTHVTLLTKYFNQVEKVSDEAYIDEAFRLVEQQAAMQKGTASMVDILIMLVADDPKNNVKGIITRNGRDFASFCRDKQLAMIDTQDSLSAI